MSNLRRSNREAVRAASASRLTYAEIAVLITLAIALVYAVMSGSRATGSLDLPTMTIRVRPADTLWDLATQHRVDGLGTAETVQLIRELNHMPDADLAAGDLLMVPASSAAAEVASRQ